MAGKFYCDPEKKKVPVVCLAGCAVVSVFGSGDYDRKNKSSSHPSGGLCCCVRFWFWREIGSFLLWRESFITTEKKSSSRLSGGLCCCVSFWFWRLRPEKKKILVVCLGGCAVVSVFGSGDYDRKKKSSSHLSGGL